MLRTPREEYQVFLESESDLSDLSKDTREEHEKHAGHFFSQVETISILTIRCKKHLIIVLLHLHISWLQNLKYVLWVFKVILNMGDIDSLMPQLSSVSRKSLSGLIRKSYNQSTTPVSNSSLFFDPRV